MKKGGPRWSEDRYFALGEVEEIDWTWEKVISNL